MIHKTGFEDNMPDSVPEQCRSCPIRSWGEFIRGLSEDGALVADSMHEVLGVECEGVGSAEKTSSGIKWSQNVCRQPSVMDGSAEAVIAAHFTEAGLILSGNLIEMIASQILANE